jgi:hypothetical protein
MSTGGGQDEKAASLAHGRAYRQCGTPPPVAMDARPTDSADRCAGAFKARNQTADAQPKVDPNRSNCAGSGDSAVIRLQSVYNPGAIAGTVVRF